MHGHRLLVLGNKMIDHERITGRGPEPVDAAAVFDVHGRLIVRVRFFGGQ